MSVCAQANNRRKAAIRKRLGPKTGVATVKKGRKTAAGK
jgi:hypothetical protein